MTNLLRQSVYSRLAGYEDVNDAQRLSVDPVMRAVTGKKKNAVSANTVGRFETEILPQKKNLEGLSEINGSWIEREYGYLRPVIKEVVEKYLDCGNPKCGFARIRCPDCGTERLLTFSCKVRGFCPSWQRQLRV